MGPTTSLLYRFTGDCVVPEGTIKLVVTLGEYPWVATIMTEFLAAFNRVLGRTLLRVLLTIKFPTIVGTGDVGGIQWDSRECYNKSLELVEKKEELP